MPKVKTPNPAAGWYFIVVLSALGGQGKTLFTELITLILRSVGYHVRVFSADVQQRLRAKLGDDVVTIDTDLLEEASEDPLAVLRAFSPLTSAVASAGNGNSLVLDTAATWDVPILKFLRDMRLDKVVTESGGQLIVALVTTSNLDAMRAMTASTELVRGALPLARPVWVLNHRLGTVFPSGFDPRLLKLEPEQFASMRAGVSEIVLPRMDDRLWQPVDRTPGLNLVKFVTADPARLATLWPDREGNPLDALSASVAQGRVASWIATMMEAAHQALGFPRAD